jgi:hypothetical protein
MESQILYAHGTRSGTGQSSLTRSAASYTRLALNAGLPVISYFCELSHEEPPPNRTRESVELSALLCSLIRQVVNLLPSGADCPEVAAIDRNRFTALDGTLRTWNEGISLFADLVQCVRLPLLLFVIDDLNVLEDESERSTEEHIERLVDTLTALMRPPSFEEDRIVKMLLTTSGGSEVLFRKVHDDDIVVCDDAPPGRSGRSRRGHQIVMF